MWYDMFDMLRWHDSVKPYVQLVLSINDLYDRRVKYEYIE